MRKERCTDTPATSGTPATLPRMKADGGAARSLPGPSSPWLVPGSFPTALPAVCPQTALGLGFPGQSWTPKEASQGQGVQCECLMSNNNPTAWQCAVLLTALSGPLLQALLSSSQSPPPTFSHPQASALWRPLLGSAPPADIQASPGWGPVSSLPRPSPELPSLCAALHISMSPGYAGPLCLCPPIKGFHSHWAGQARWQPGQGLSWEPWGLLDSEGPHQMFWLQAPSSPTVSGGFSPGRDRHRRANPRQWV